MFKKLRIEMRKQVTLAVSAAFALVIALTWNDTIKKIVDSFVIRLSLPETVYMHQIAVAAVVTAICVSGIIINSRFSVKKE
jgi:hypothetical protein